jgi:hypothetical protein
MRRKLAIAAALAAPLLLTACGSVRIARIESDPTRFRNRVITVEGRVTTSVGAMGTGAYQVDDGTGRLIVVSRSGVPESGRQVRVRGKVSSGVQIMGRTYGLVLREQSHKSR